MISLIKWGILAVCLLAGSVPVFGTELDDNDRLRLALDLGTLIGSEKQCGFNYEQQAIRAYIDQRVPVDDISFVRNLNMFTRGMSRDIEQMSESAKTAHCEQIHRATRAVGFLQ